MEFRLINGRFLAGFALSGFMLAAAGCQSGDAGGVLGLGGDRPKQPAEGKVLESELRAYCPPVTLREGTGVLQHLREGRRGRSRQDVYQASISDVTRSCTRADGMLTMNVAVAGRVVPGPAGVPGTVTMPIRIVVAAGRRGALFASCTNTRSRSATARRDAVRLQRSERHRADPARTARCRSLPAIDEGPPKKKQRKTQFELDGSCA